MTMSQRKGATSASERAIWMDGFEKILRAMLETHQRLLVCLERKQQAVRTANLELVNEIFGEENAILQRISEMEKRRVELIARVTGSSAPIEVRLADFVERFAVDEAQRTRLLALGAQLRESVAEVRKQSSIIRAAAETLARHMGGIVQVVQGALSRAGVYGNRGRVQLGAQVQSAIDLKS
jgi:hypothetical protein